MERVISNKEIESITVYNPYHIEKIENQSIIRRALVDIINALFGRDK
jgi:hypothetical protein